MNRDCTEARGKAKGKESMGTAGFSAVRLGQSLRTCPFWMLIRMLRTNRQISLIGQSPKKRKVNLNLKYWWVEVGKREGRLDDGYQHAVRCRLQVLVSQSTEWWLEFTITYYVLYKDLREELIDSRPTARFDWFIPYICGWKCCTESHKNVQHF